MDLSKEWYRSEFVNQEMLEQHRVIETEYMFYDAIANGNIEYVQDNCINQTFTNPDGMGKLSEDKLQNIRYHFVVTTAMITRYCVHAGMEQEQAYSLSDFYILKMDKCRTIDQISRLHDTMCLDFCSRMNELKRRQILSKPIVLCLNYIYSHIHYRITIKELAEYMSLSESYLSKLFLKIEGNSAQPLYHRFKNRKSKKSAAIFRLQHCRNRQLFLFCFPEPFYSGFPEKNWHYTL